MSALAAVDLVPQRSVLAPAPPGRPASAKELLALYKGLVEVSTLINAITDYSELLTAVMDVARRVMRAEGSALILLNERTDQLELVVARSTEGEVRTAHQVVPRQGSIAGWVFEQGISALVPDAYEDPRFYPGVDRKTGLRTRSILCVPLPRNRREHRLGVLQVLNAIGEDRPAFDLADQEALEAFANLAATAIEKLRFVEEQERRARFEQELTIATEIQQSFLPASLPKRADMTFAARYRPALAVGGDFYDLFELGPDEIYFVIGDVAGKGVPAALLMAQSLSVLRLIIVPGIDPAEALARWNTTLCRRSRRGLFVTSTLGRIVPSRRIVEMASAGHHFPLLIHQKTDAENLFLPEEVAVPTGPPLAVVAHMRYRSVSVTLAPLDNLLLYTDGLTDSICPDTGGRLGEAGARLMLKKDVASPARVVEALLEGEAAYRGDAPPQDDLTLLAFGFSQ